MPFCKKNEKAILRAKVQNKKSERKKMEKNEVGRMASLYLPLLGRRVPANLTVETALVLPIFLFALISILYFSEVIRYSNVVASSLHQSVRAMASWAYVTEESGIDDSGTLGGMAGGIAISETYVRGRVSKDLRLAKVKERSISYLRSKILDDDIIDLVAVSEIELPYEFLGIGKFKIIDRARVHAYTGYDVTHAGKRDESEEIVYITPEGSVYHRSRNCSHLKVTVKTVSEAELEKRRNSSGGKYYRCEYCGSSGSKASYYITDYGDRYHTKANCSALKRDVISVPISEVKGRPACKTCG